MGKAGQKFSILAVIVAAAFATPALAAGQVKDTSVAMTAGSDAIDSAVTTADEGAGSDMDASPDVATHAPAQLSILAGNGSEAWESVHSVHVVFPHRRPH